jgi:PAS domain S-box-containing protein
MPTLPKGVDPQWFFSTVLTSLPEVLILVDSTDRIAFASGACRRLLGWKPNQLQGRPVADLITPSAGLDMIEFAEQTDAALSARVEVRHADGRQVPMALTSSPLAPSDQHPYQALIALREMAEELAVQDALAARNHQLATLGRASGMVAVGGELKPLLERLLLITMQSLRLHAATIHLIDRAHNTGRLLIHRGVPREIVDHFDKLEFQPQWLQRLATEIEPAPAIELPFLPEGVREKLTKHRLDNAQAMALVSKGVPFGLFTFMSLAELPAEDRALLEAVAGQMALAIEKDHLLRNLRESERKYSTLVEMANDGIMISQDGVFQFVNKKLADMLGYTVSDLLGMPIQSVMFHDDEKLMMEGYRRRISGDVPKEIYPGRLVARSGDPVAVELNAVSIEFDGRQASLSFVRDLTLRLKLRRELIAEKESAEFYNDVLTHDVSNFLHTISGNLDLMGDSMFDKLDEAQDRFRVRALANARRCSGLIDRVREMMAIRHLDPESFMPVRLKHLLEEAGEIVREQFQDEEFDLQFDVEPNQHFLGHSLAGQIFVNLIANAIRHNSKAEKTIRVAVSEARSGKHWEISVEDNGDGIEDRVKEKIYDRFTRFSPKGGLGLGMSIVKALVAAMQGEIKVEDRLPGRPAEGTRFTVLLPKG